MASLLPLTHTIYPSGAPVPGSFVKDVVLVVIPTKSFPPWESAVSIVNGSVLFITITLELWANENVKGISVTSSIASVPVPVVKPSK